MAKHGDVWRSPCGAMELRCGAYQDVLADVERVDAVITDPPYSERTHAGERGSRLGAGQEADYNAAAGVRCPRNAIAYAGIDAAWCVEFAESWHARTRFWAVVFGDDVACSWHKAAWVECGWVDFAPVIWRRLNPPPRFSGDGPTSSCEHITVARPRGHLPPERRGSRPGDYSALTMVGRGQGASGLVGSKDPDAMRAIVRDYSRPGDLVCDPCAGGGTTLLAAAMEGRRAVGAELDPATFEKAVKRLSRGYTPPLIVSERAEPEQIALGEVEP
jgi:site-specific DNA-methyltransferase (adenine-specific)